VTFELLADIPAPTGASDQYFCNTEAWTLADLIVENTEDFDGIYWYEDEDQTGDPLDMTTVIENGDIYWAFQGIGACAVGLEVEVHIQADIPAPEGDSDQYYCTSDNLTLADLIVTSTLAGAEVIWFAEDDNTGIPIDPTSISLDTDINGTTYYVFQGLGVCAESLAVTIHENCEYIKVIKEASISSDNIVCGGDEIDYTITVENIGVVELEITDVFDPLLEGLLTLDLSTDLDGDGKLDADETWVYTGTYVVPQEVIDGYGIYYDIVTESLELGNDGIIENCVKIEGVSVNGTSFNTDDMDEENHQLCVDVAIDYSNEGEPILVVTKEADVEVVYAEGDVITYTITVENTSCHAVTEVFLDDAILDEGSVHLVSGDDNNNGILDGGEIWVYEGTHTVTLETLMEQGLDIHGEYDGDGDIDNIAEICGVLPDLESICQESNEVVVLIDFVFIPDAFSPDDDDINDIFEIIGLHKKYPDFKLQIFNRWGNKVYEYENKGNLDPEWWDGISTGRAVINKNKQVPTGTYYFILDFNDGEREPLVDWLYIKRD
jgi:gliding motility-associated-like protein/uncharacterized repeat protein (TIGR01451 family)